MGAALHGFSRTKSFDTTSIQETKLARVLTTFDLTFLGVGSTLGAGVYVVTGDIARDLAGPGVVLSFVIAGWNLFLEYMIGAAAVARAWSSYFNSLIGNRMSRALISVFGRINTRNQPLSGYLFVRLSVIIAVVLAIGVKRSTRFQGAITRSVGICNGVFAFVGFDVIASTGEEAKNPSRAIPLSIILSLALCSLGYCGVASVVTLLVPYNKLDPEAALPKAFEHAGITWAKYIISIGGLCGLTASLTGAMFPLPRLLYAMATDGLIFKPFGWVNKRTETPLFSTILAGIMAGTLAMMFELSSLVEMMSIGTLQAYTIVATSVLLLRYQPHVLGQSQEKSDTPIKNTGPVDREPTERTGKLASGAVCILFLDMFGLSAVSIYGMNKCKAVTLLIVTGLALLAVFVSAVTVIVLQPQNKHHLPFKVPFVPVLPIASMFVNIYLMMELSHVTWIRFGVWMFIGMTIYLCYGIHNSLEHPRNIKLKEQQKQITHLQNSFSIEQSSRDTQ
eukprot:gene15066-16621_t